MVPSVPRSRCSRPLCGRLDSAAPPGRVAVLRRSRVCLALGRSAARRRFPAARPVAASAGLPVLAVAGPLPRARRPRVPPPAARPAPLRLCAPPALGAWGPAVALCLASGPLPIVRASFSSAGAGGASAFFCLWPGGVAFLCAFPGGRAGRPLCARLWWRFLARPVWVRPASAARLVVPAGSAS